MEKSITKDSAKNPAVQPKTSRKHKLFHKFREKQIIAHKFHTFRISVSNTKVFERKFWSKTLVNNDKRLDIKNLRYI